MSHRSNPRPLLPPPSPTEELQTTTSPDPANDNDADSSASADELLDGAHLDGIEIAGEGIAGDSAGADATTSPPAPACLSRDDFAALWCGCFGIASQMTGLRSLAVDSPEVKPRAVAAAHTVYEIAEEVPALRFLIEPGNKWVQRAFVLGAFAVPMGTGVAAELRARRAKPVNQSPSREREKTRAAANDNVAPAAAGPIDWAPVES